VVDGFTTLASGLQKDLQIFDDALLPDEVIPDCGT
jgi:hypothetical protein